MSIISKRARRVNPIPLEESASDDEDDDDISEYEGAKKEAKDAKRPGTGRRHVGIITTGIGRSVKHSLSACKFCKSKKIKCSGDLPCERCKKMGIECVYLKTSRYFKQHKRKPCADGEEKKQEMVDDASAIPNLQQNALASPAVMGINNSRGTSAAAAGGGGGQVGGKQQAKRKGEEDEEDELQLTTVSGVQQPQFYPSLSSGNVIFERKVPALEYREGSNHSTSSVSHPSCQNSSSRGNLQQGEKGDDEVLSWDKESSITPSSSSSSPSQSLLCARQGFSEMMMADTASATFLMDVFVSKVLPHFSTFNPGEVLLSLDNPRSALDQMRRDGALALACRNCGHEGLASLLRERMERCSEVVAQLWSASEEVVGCFFMLHVLLATENFQKSLTAAQAMFRMYRASLPAAEANMDPVEALCQPLQTLNLSGDPMPRDVTPAEVEALVRHSAEQLVMWSQTMEDLRLRAFLGFYVDLRLTVTAPGLRPASTLIIAIIVDLQLLGLLVPPYLMEALSRHDPRGAFGIGAFFKPGVPLDALMDPIALPNELGDLFLRRIAILRALFLLSPFHPLTLPPPLVATQVIEAIVTLRMGNTSRAMELAWGIIHLVEHHDMNFWPPMIPQLVFLATSVFYEAGSPEGIDQIILKLLCIQRSTPHVQFALNALLELRQRVADRLRGVQKQAMQTAPQDLEEPFEIFDENNVTCGEAKPRGWVHKLGLFHRAVQVLVFSDRGRLGMQQRHLHKDVAPGAWDISCSEHLKPSETYQAGAERGLQEELGVDLSKHQPTHHLFRVVPHFLQERVYPSPISVIDREFVEIWAVQGVSEQEGGNCAVSINQTEVAAWEWVEVDEILQDIQPQQQSNSGVPRRNLAPWVAESLLKVLEVNPSLFLK